MGLSGESGAMSWVLRAMRFAGLALLFSAALMSRPAVADEHSATALTLSRGPGAQTLELTLENLAALPQTTHQIRGEPFLSTGVRRGDRMSRRPDHGNPHQVASTPRPAR